MKKHAVKGLIVLLNDKMERAGEIEHVFQRTGDTYSTGKLPPIPSAFRYLRIEIPHKFPDGLGKAADVLLNDDPPFQASRKALSTSTKKRKIKK